MAFKKEQLLYRRLEIYLAYQHFKSFINSGTSDTNFGTIDGPWNFDLDHRPDDTAFWSSWRQDPTSSIPPVDCTNIDIAGHSYGGATVVR